MSSQIDLEIRYNIHPDHAKVLDTQALRREFLIQDLFVPEKVKLIYSHIDRIIVGGAVPLSEVKLEMNRKTLGADYLLERRELGVINLGGPGEVLVDGVSYTLNRLDALYVGKGNKDVRLRSLNPSDPAKFYFLSGTAHTSFPTRRVTKEEARKVSLGALETSNKRTIYQMLHPEILPTCNLVMGVTCLEVGSVWNTMPPHTHERRMEVYLYFDLPQNAIVFHFIGLPKETRHIVVRNEEAVIAPSWSIHCGVGTCNYSFVWGMVGENQAFDDMDAVSLDSLF
ncbi:MAG: 5-dehydro-4-deoxy-D-glucuronate isomerase [Synergistetes bacterium]|nr:5-dehydro-4-deoxy-D-glucuronate isomerase [Synergistota bacterium]MCX8127585.1 5-dehydro-4-deoxy-D-glucuronate isomerase [Synergistota bacterium]MDW8191498.1 5-dehydro-4-deoxy-D-glucuronate isomerase [Synergistota bacterium]